MVQCDADRIDKISSIMPNGIKGCPEGISAIMPNGIEGCPEGISAIMPNGIEGSFRIILIGTEHSKRRIYFEKAAKCAGVCCSFYDWKDVGLIGQNEDLERCIVKIDAPEWESCRLNELDMLTRQYEEKLLALSKMPFGAFWNRPEDIAELLDKRKCKKRLVQNGIAVTEMFEETFSSRDDLFDFMREKRIHQVFLKPVKGSGAAGVTALHLTSFLSNGTCAPVGRKGYLEGASLRRGKLALYTCAALKNGELVNTKRMYRLEGTDAEAYLDQLLKLDCVVEKWYRKAKFEEYCYDLRVIVQDGQIDYILPRLSKGPITNLQLNNHSKEFEALQLDKDAVPSFSGNSSIHLGSCVPLGKNVERIAELCMRAADCYPGLTGIGIDVLLEKGSLQPYIIEMNAQGDLLHRDIYAENRIYSRQIEILKSKYGML